ncbi:MAG: DUF4159 domain-containing protein [Kiritimatiellia bacterium]|nr:DUF4159 domain-containing protein [Kiritimatiellia bacterium]MDP6847274.1 DUF4159 domain-containing protein [Kiritimatiellia bacterium]
MAAWGYLKLLMRKIPLRYENGDILSPRMLQVLLCFPLAFLAAISACFTVDLPYFHYERYLEDFPELTGLFSSGAVPPILLSLSVANGLCAVLFLLAALSGPFRKGWALRMLRKGYAAAYALFVFHSYVIMSVSARVEASDLEELGGNPLHSVAVFYWRCEQLWLPACIVVFIGFLHLLSWRRSTINVYTGADDGTLAAGDRIFENIRTHGDDPKFRKSTLSSIWTHILIIIIIPLLLRMQGCIDPYRPPYGGGKPVVQVVQVVKQKKKKKRKQFILTPDSAIIFRAPELDESKILEEVEDESKLTYVADPNAVHGKLGDGDAKTPGWQDGFKDGIVRFIRLEYNGQDWDDGMGKQSGADMNFLRDFREMSGGMKTATHSESHPVRLLKKYPKGQAPPFVYMTGSGHINVSERDIKILREFLMDGSMLFADCGSPHWDRSFKGLANRLFPGNPLREISDDDPIFQIPFAFANGAPPLWHHGGNRAMGVKVKNRWVIFYHPGDMNDAWKTGHSGMKPELARKSTQVGVNVVYYSFMRYFEATRKYRK